MEGEEGAAEAEAVGEVRGEEEDERGEEVGGRGEGLRGKRGVAH